MMTEFPCPVCGTTMEPIESEDLRHLQHVRVCPACKVLAWEENARTEIRYPQEVPAAEVRKAKADRSTGVLAVLCPHCGATNTFPGWSEMFIFLCHSCGEPVEVEESVQ